MVSMNGYEKLPLNITINSNTKGISCLYELGYIIIVGYVMTGEKKDQNY